MVDDYQQACQSSQDLRTAVLAQKRDRVRHRQWKVLWTAMADGSKDNSPAALLVDRWLREQITAVSWHRKPQQHYRVAFENQ